MNRYCAANSAAANRARTASGTHLRRLPFTILIVCRCPAHHVEFSYQLLRLWMLRSGGDCFGLQSDSHSMDIEWRRSFIRTQIMPQAQDRM